MTHPLPAAPSLTLAATLSLSPALIAPPVGMPAAPPEGAGCLMALLGGESVPLPLQRVRVRAELSGLTARTICEQRFQNGGAEALEVTYIFPLPPEGALVGMRLRVGDRVVEAQLQPKAQAAARFAEARAQGQLAGMVTQQRADVHTLSLTRVPAGAIVEVEVRVEEQLRSIDGALWWRFPTVIAPRYTPGQAIGHSGPGVSADTDLVPDASHISPPLRIGGGATLDLQVRLLGPWASVATSQHSMELRMEDGAAVVRPAGPATCDRDFVLRLVTGAPAGERLIARTDGSFTEVVLHPAGGSAVAQRPRDAVYLLDISGSMGGEKIVAARLALRAAIAALGPQDTLQIIAFDDRLERWSAKPQPVTEAAVSSAGLWIARQEARGGTELLPALQSALAEEAGPGRLRTVLVITDGESTDEARLVPCVAGRRGRTIVSTLGIDTAVNAALLGDLAQVGGGVCALCTPQDDIEAAVAGLELAVGAPQATALRLGSSPQCIADNDAPQTLFAGRPLVWLLEGAAATVRVQGDGVDLEATVSATASPLAATWAAAKLRALGLRRRLRPFEAEAIDPELTRVSLLGQVLGPTTAWIVVDPQSQAPGVQRSVVQPVALPAGWDEGGRGGAVPQADLAAYASPAVGAAFAVGSAPAAAMRHKMAKMSAPRGRQAPPAPGAPPPPPAAAPFMAARDTLSRMASALFGGAPPPAPEMDDAESETVFEEEAVAGAFFDAPAEPAPEALKESAARRPSQAAKPIAAPAPAPQRRAEASLSVPSGERELVASQAPDGSFGDVLHTIVALMRLAQAGHSRALGLRQRTVRRALDWLAAQPAEPALCAMVLQLFDELEAQGAVSATTWGRLRGALGPAGAALPQQP